MDPERIHAYLQAACAGLGFDIGEVWFSSNETGTSTSTVATIESRVGTRPSNSLSNKRDIKFLQLYTSKSYNNRRNDLLRPESNAETKNNLNDGKNVNSNLHKSSSDEEIKRHVLSPKLVNAIANSAQVVWANCQEREGLLGRSDMRLQTAVGMPVAMDADGNMCIVVMFSPNNVQSNTDAVEYLKCLSEGATSTSIPCLLPVVDQGTKTLTFNPKRFSDFEEHEETVRKRLDNGTLQPMEGNSDDPLDDELPGDFFGIQMFGEIGDSQNPDGSSLSGGSDDGAAANAFDQATYGLWSTIMDNPGIINSAMDDIPEETTSAAVAISTTQTSSSYDQNMLHPEQRERLEEFTSAFLAMSVFDAADFWMPTIEPNGTTSNSLRHYFSLTSNDNNSCLNYFKIASNNVIIESWSGAVGRAFCSGCPVWSTNTETIVDTPRAEAFAIANVKTCLAVPIFSTGVSKPSCVLAFYSMVRSDCVPFVLKFVQRALRSLWFGLESLKPHKSIGKDLWKDVAPADLGEMAADLEMQKAFYQRKRPFGDISTKQERAPSDDPNATLMSQMQSMTTPSGEVSVPLNSETTQMHHSNRQFQHSKELQNHLHEAIKLAADAKPVSNENTAKRMNIGHSTSYFVSQNQAQHAAQMQNNLSSEQSNNASSPMNDLLYQQQDFSQVYSTHISQPQQIQHGLQQPPPLQMATIHQGPQQLQQEQMNNQQIYHIQQSQLQQHTQQFSQNAAVIPPTLSNAPPFPPLSSQPSHVANTSTTSPLYCQAAATTSAPVPIVKAQAKGSKQICKIQGCDQVAASRRPYCTKHSGNRLCEHQGCTKCAQGATRFCIGHGGGRRCTYPGCDKGARDKFFCAAHGGGKRCKQAGCNKSAVGGSNLCTSHGGGRRCAVEGCQKSAQSSTKFCVKHGGGKKCAHEGCEKVARGRTQFCAGHGGGVRCKLDGCTRIAIGKMQLCRTHGGGSKRKL